VAICFAAHATWRSAGTMTAKPSAIRSVAAAANPSRIVPSSMGTAPAR
jgi:hypothetical protein